MDIFEEGNKGNELIVLDIAFPRFQDDGILGLSADMLGFGVYDYDFGKIAVKVGEILCLLVYVLE